MINISRLVDDYHFSKKDIYRIQRVFRVLKQEDWFGLTYLIEKSLGRLLYSYVSKDVSYKEPLNKNKFEKLLKSETSIAVQEFLMNAHLHRIIHLIISKDPILYFFHINHASSRKAFWNGQGIEEFPEIDKKIKTLDLLLRDSWINEKCADRIKQNYVNLTKEFYIDEIMGFNWFENKEKDLFYCNRGLELLLIRAFKKNKKELQNNSLTDDHGEKLVYE